MKIDDIVVGGIYRNGKQVRKVLSIVHGNVTYVCVEGRSKGTVRVCWITTIAGWAKERVEDDACVR